MPEKRGKALLGLLFSALFGYLFATQVDWPQLRQALAWASPALIGGLIALGADYAVREGLKIGEQLIDRITGINDGKSAAQ